MRQIEEGLMYEDYQGENEDLLYPSDEDMQTLHIYVYEEDPYQPTHWNKDRIVALGMGILALAFFMGLCFLPSGDAYRIQTMIVPAHFSAQTFQAETTIVPTGIQSYKASSATGTLTIYNGIVFAQPLPAHFILTTQDGQEVTTDDAVTVPAENTATNPPSNGIATVSAHALVAGSSGNIQAGAINAVYGSSLVIKNLTPFTGGHDAYTQTYATSADKTKALDTTRAQLAAKQPIGLLVRPCLETVQQAVSSVAVVWQCQYVTYQAPKGVQVLSIRVQGEKVFLTVRTVARTVTTHFTK